MKRLLLRVIPICVVVMLLTVSCSSVSTMNTWKDEKYTGKISSVLIIGIAEADYMKNHFENGLAMRLSERGIKAVASNTIFNDTREKLDREAVVAKIKELGLGSVLVGQVVSREDHNRMTASGYFVVSDTYADNWYNGYSSGFTSMAVAGSSYDVEYFNMLVNLYDAGSDKLVWSDLVRIKVEMSRQAMVNPFLDVLVKDMEAGKVISGK